MIPASTTIGGERASRIAPMFWVAAVVILAIDWATKFAAHVVLTPDSSHAIAGTALSLPHSLERDSRDRIPPPDRGVEVTRE